mgnify:CR=1 FL=1
MTLREGESKVGYRHGEKVAELETMDHLEFIARVMSQIPDKGQVRLPRIPSTGRDFRDRSG